MKHFHGLDGMRAWLAWIVVFAHAGMLTATDMRYPRFATLDAMSNHAVSIFIIISGFVITHLIVERQEKYIPYITRRFLRIYPIYILSLALGVFSTWLYVDTFKTNPWGEWLPQPEFLKVQESVYQGNNFFAYLIPHIFLYHGLIPNNILNETQFLFLGPAWSLSLEWQFYLVAPLILFALRFGCGKIIVPLLTVAGYYAYVKGWLGDYEAPSPLPGAGLFFATGIATRFAIPKLSRTAGYPVAAIIVGIAFLDMSHLLIPFFVWAAFISWMVMGNKPADRLSGLIKRGLDMAFDSRLMRYLGERSYSTYLVHYPLTHLLVYTAVKLMGLSMVPTIILVFIGAPLLTLLASVVLYRCIEAPVIAYGKRLFNEPK